MPTQVQFRRGTTTQNNSFTGAVGEISIDTTLDTIRVHDGSTAGGHRLAKYSEIGDITSVVAGDGLTGGGTSGDVTLTVGVDDSSIELSSDAVQVKALGVTNAMLAGSIANAKLANSTITIDGSAIALGGSVTTNNTQLSDEQVQDITGAQIATNGSHTNLTATYNDSDADGAIDLAITDATIRGKVSVTDSGGDGSLAYNNSTGVITYTGPSASEVRAHLSAGTGVTYSGGAISIGQAVSTSSNVTFGNLVLSGDLTVNGTTTTVATSNTVVSDNLIELGNGTSGTPGNDSGIVIERGDSDNVFIGWDESTDNVVIGTGSFTGATTGNLTHTAANFTAAIGTFASLDISGNVDVDGTMEADAYTVDGTTLAEFISDTVGAMVSSNTESGITVAYDDSDNTLDFTVGTLNQNTTGSAATLTTARAIALAGDVVGTANFDGSAGISITTTIQANSVALGTDTTGNYMVNVSAGDGISISHTPGEGSTATITGLAVYDSGGTKLN